MTWNHESKKILIPLCNTNEHKWSVVHLNEIGGWKSLNEPEKNIRHFEKCLICGIARDDVDAVQT